MPPRHPATAQQVALHIKEKHLGSQDIEVADSIDFCAYIEKTYGGDSQGMDRLKDKFHKVEEDLSRAQGWHPGLPIATVVDQAPEDIPDFMVAPRQIGCTAGHSVKG